MTPPDDALVLRRSDVDSFGYCGERYHLAQTTTQQSSEALVFGQAEHLIIEQLLDDSNLSHKLCEWAVEFVLREEYGTTLLKQIGSKQKANEFKHELYAAAKEWRKKVRPKLPEMISAEEKMMAKVGLLESGRELWITGIPDYVAENELIDWKTAYKMWPEAKMYSTTQPMVYSWLLEQTGGYASSFTYWIYSRSMGEWARMRRPITTREVEAAMQLVFEVGASIDAEIYPASPFSGLGSRPRGWWCSPRYCDGWDICTAKHLITDAIVNDPAITGWN